MINIYTKNQEYHHRMYGIHVVLRKRAQHLTKINTKHIRVKVIWGNKINDNMFFT